MRQQNLMIRIFLIHFNAPNVTLVQNTLAETEAPFETEFGENHSYSKLICYPQLTILWAGYPCHAEYYFRPTGSKSSCSIASDSTKKWWNGTQKDYDEFDSCRDGNKATKAEVNGIKLVFSFYLKI